MTVRVVESRNADQYDGTNGAAIAAIFGLTPSFDDGSVLKLVVGGEEVSINNTDWVLWRGTAGSAPFSEPISDAYFSAVYRPLPRFAVSSDPLADGGTSVHVTHD